MTYLNAQKYITAAPSEPVAGQLSALLSALGNPQRRLRYLRLAGTNGKTVCAEMLSAILKETEYTVGALRMPIRSEQRENVCINGTPISMSEFSSHMSEIKRIITEQQLILTGNEMILAVALCAFRDAGCRFCLIECNHQGSDPSVSLPPPISAVICGTIPSDDASEISRVRSYISRGTEEVISAPQNPKAYRIISDICYSASCRLTLPTRTAVSVDRTTLRGVDFTYRGESYSLNVCGSFQVTNAVIVIEIVEMLERKGFAIGREAVRQGFANLKLPCKFEVISLSPLMIVDSTHTPVAIKTVCDSFAEFSGAIPSKVRLCLPDKETIDSYRAELSSRGFSTERVFTCEPTEDGSVTVCKNTKSMAKAALSELDKDTVLMVSGDHPFVSPLRYELLAIMGF